MTKSLIRLARFIFGFEKTVRLDIATSHTAAQLMQLTQPKTLRIHNNHHRRLRDIDTYFNDRGTHEHIDFPVLERAHDRILFIVFQLPVQ